MSEQKKAKEITDSQLIKVKPVTDNQKVTFEAFLRGLTFDNSIIVVDECQNLNFHELDTIITRVGQNSRIIFCGDIDQSDLVKTQEKNGILDFTRVLEQMDEFTLVEYNLGDIVRSGFVRNYLINKIKLGLVSG